MIEYREIMNHISRLYQLLHRYNPFRAEVGLERIGCPTPDSPVFVSGNYETTVWQIREFLAPFDCWLLVCDSAGINVWCAAGVGDFNENKIVDAVISTKLSEQIRHRTLILPALAAVGVDCEKLRKETGFRVIWGPVHGRDLPEYIRAGLKRTPEMKLAVFPLRDRLEQAIGIFGVFLFPAVLAFWWPGQVGWFMISLFHAIFGTMLGFSHLPPKYPANKTLLLGGLQAVGLAIWRLMKGKSDRRFFERLFLGALAHFLIAIDMIGSTPFYKTTIVSWLKSGNNSSLFQPGLNENCTSCGKCAEVCPKGLFSRGGDRKIGVDLRGECCECLACIKQCPVFAIDNVGTGFKDDIRSIDEAELRKLRIPRNKTF